MKDRIAAFLRGCHGGQMNKALVDRAGKAFKDADSVSVRFNPKGNAMTLRVLHGGRWHQGDICILTRVA